MYSINHEKRSLFQVFVNVGDVTSAVEKAAFRVTEFIYRLLHFDVSKF